MAWGLIVFLWIVWVALGLVIANHKNRSVGEAIALTVILGLIGVIILLCLPTELPKAPPGMYAVKCSRCGAGQNLPMGQAEFTCWQCHTTQQVARGVLS